MLTKRLFSVRKISSVYLEAFQRYLEATLTQRNINTLLYMHNIDIVLSVCCLNYCLCFEKLN